MFYQIVPGIVALALGTTAFAWLFDPATAAVDLGMPYLEGMARSTQVGDLSAMFVFLVIMCAAGAITKSGHYLQNAGLLLLLIAVFRTTAWFFHGAELATTFITIEVILAVVLFFCGSRIERNDELI